MQYVTMTSVRLEGRTKNKEGKTVPGRITPPGTVVTMDEKEAASRRLLAVGSGGRPALIPYSKADHGAPDERGIIAGRSEVIVQETDRKRREALRARGPKAGKG